MFEEMYREIEQQSCEIKNIKVLSDYLDKDIESLMEAPDLSPYRRDMAHNCFLLLGMISEKLKELDVITAGLDDKVGKILDRKGYMGVFEEKSENENPG